MFARSLSFLLLVPCAAAQVALPGAGSGFGLSDSVRR